MAHQLRRKPDLTGHLGQIAVTALENRLFTLIRYLNGDIGRAIKGTCECGVNLPLMDKVRGRTTDTLRFPNGKCISGDL